MMFTDHLTWERLASNKCLMMLTILLTRERLEARTA
jgi:hypothetical protein